MHALAHKTMVQAVPLLVTGPQTKTNGPRCDWFIEKLSRYNRTVEHMWGQHVTKEGGWREEELSRLTLAIRSGYTRLDLK